MTVSLILRVVALVAFVLAAVVALGSGTFDHDAVLVPVGLACWVGSTLVP
jgi:hypothetical protein